MPELSFLACYEQHGIMKISFILISILTFSLQVRGQEDPDYISIDCGAPNDYHHDDLDIDYKTDASFIDTGVNMQVSAGVFNDNYEQQSKNLRIFPNGTRNCYTLRPKQGRGNTYLVRAAFWYGNYDGINQTPVFDLYIDTNYWSTVNYTSYIYVEVIYVSPRDYIQVCLVNIGLGVPFISVLELRTLDNSTYKIPSTSSGALYTNWRYNIGSTSTFRHPQDDYDRIWSNKTFTGWTSVTNATPVATPTSNDAYRVPEEVLMTAQQTSALNETFDVFWTWKPGYVWYVFFHFAEVEDLKGQVREMDIYMMDKYVDTVSLQNQVPLTVVSLPATGQRIEFMLNATARSDLPPLLNALEIFTLLNLPNSQTDSDDFDGINDIKTNYEIDKESWQGDPCVPQNMTWEGLNCSYDNNVPRITTLNLSSSNLTRTIATSFSNLTAMTSLDLSNNGLTGPIPAFFAQMQNLRFINLSGNHLSGPIPVQLKKREEDRTIQLSLDDNLLCPTASCQPTSTHRKRSIISTIAVVVVLGIIVSLWRLDKKKNKQAPTGSTKSKLKSKNRPFTHGEVLQITNNFSIVIGEGGFGKVYLGTLDNGDRVAVKMLSQASTQGHKQFEAEVQLLMFTHHRNLVSLVGYCDDIKNMALIYEYIPAGNLGQHLLGESTNSLTWIQRLQIAVDVGEGLNYLHHGCKPPIIHRDLKSSNILLSENMQAKIADFGLSKAFRNERESHIFTCPAGTPGYLDPEFHSSGNLSRKSDVYSFGIILFELTTGRSAILRGPNGNTHILHWVTPLIQSGDIESIMDPRLEGQFNISSAWKVVETAMSCVAPTAIQRPDITHVLQELKECLNMEASGSRGSFRMNNLELDFDGTPSAR